MNDSLRNKDNEVPVNVASSKSNVVNVLGNLSEEKSIAADSSVSGSTNKFQNKNDAVHPQTPKVPNQSLSKDSSNSPQTSESQGMTFLFIGVLFVVRIRTG
jgi:ABC-type Na+ efflux pump permease subunit